MMQYNHFAYVYDYFMSDAPYDTWVQLTIELMNKHHISGQTIVDLGCGTGEIALRLAENQYDVYGVDFSPQMLAVAQQKASSRHIQIDWIQQDIRHLDGFSNVDVFISYCDVMNYITKTEDLMKVFQHVYKSLKNDGLFIFDVHHLPYVEEKLKDHTFADVTDDVAYIWHCIGGGEVGEMYHQMTFFSNVDKTSPLYERFDEEHVQRTYPIDVYKQLLQQVGFRKFEIFADFSLEKQISEKDTERIFILAQK